jgi:hypothetical protein
MGILDQVSPDQRSALLNPLERSPLLRGPQEAMYLGEGARTWDPNAAAMADAISQTGAPLDQVRQETGYFQGPDRHIRTELDDSQAKLKMPDRVAQSPLMELLHGPKWDTKSIGTLSDVLDHPELYKAYPWLRETPLTVRDDLPAGVRAGTDLNSGHLIVSGSRFADGQGPLLESLLHEVQHAIQNREGWAQGSSPEIEQHEAFRQWLARSKMPDVKPEMYQKPSTAELLGRYQRSFGEIEARDTGQRRTMDSAARQQIPPYAGQRIPPDQWIVRGQR